VGGAGERGGEGAPGEKLDLLDTFPALTLNLAGGGRLTLPEDLTTSYAIVLFYRGHW
jgi:hypothetical protein